MKIRPFALVSWKDAFTIDGSETYSVESTEKIHRSMDVLTAGWVLRHDDHGITIASELFSETNEFRGLTFIPKAMITRIEYPSMRSKKEKV